MPQRCTFQFVAAELSELDEMASGKAAQEKYDGSR
jgi:hypothetical protein